MDGAKKSLGWAVFGAALVLLLGTADESLFGGIRDGKEMLSAAYALSHYGEIGVSRQFVNAAPGPGGEAYSRYGMGTSLVEAVPMLLSRLLLAAAPSAPPAPTGPLFALVPILCLALTAVFTARSLLLLGASPPVAAGIGLVLVFASPLFGYASSDYSEPIQVATLSLALLAVLTLRTDTSASRKWEMVAGAAAAFAVLTKSLNVVPASLLLLPALVQRAVPQEAATKKRKKQEAPPRLSIRWGVAGSYAAGLALWAAIDLFRFGKLFGGYPGEDFPYPFLTGLLRLTVFPNKGLLVYAPLLLLVPVGFIRCVRKDRMTALALALAASAASYFAISASWWAWDGQSGWGPRLVVPALPILFLFVGAAVENARRSLVLASAALGAAGLIVNLPGALYPFAGAYVLAETTDPQPIPPGRAEGTPYEVFQQPDGTLTATGPHHLSLSPSWWPPRFHARLIAEKWKGGDVEGRLVEGAMADLTPPFLLRPPRPPSAGFEIAVAPRRWPFWGRSWLWPARRQIDPYRDAMKDQLFRAMSTGRSGRADALRAALGPDAPPAAPVPASQGGGAVGFPPGGPSR